MLIVQVSAFPLTSRFFFTVCLMIDTTPSWFVSIFRREGFSGILNRDYWNSGSSLEEGARTWLYTAIAAVQRGLIVRCVFTDQRTSSPGCTERYCIWNCFPMCEHCRHFIGLLFLSIAFGLANVSFEGLPLCLHTANIILMATLTWLPIVLLHAGI